MTTDIYMPEGRMVRVGKPLFTSGLTIITDPAQLFQRGLDIRVTALLQHDVPGLGNAGELITTSRIERIDFINCFAVTRSGSIYRWS